MLPPAKHLHLATHCFLLGGEGQPMKSEVTAHAEQALKLAIHQRHWSEAARLALDLERILEAGHYWLQAGRPYEAAVCFQRVGALKQCHQALTQVPVTSARYRSACIHAVRVSRLLELPLANVSAFLMPFVSSKPESTVEADVFNQIAIEFLRLGKVRLARSVFSSVLGQFPEDTDAREGLASAGSLNERAEPGQASAPAAPRRSARAAPRNPKLGELLQARGAITNGALERVYSAHPEVAGSDALLADALVAEGCLSQIDIVRALAEHSGLELLTDEALLAIDPTTALAAVTVQQAERWKVVPIALHDRHLTVAMRDPRDVAAIDQLLFLTGMKQLSGVFATELGIRQAIRKFYYGEEAGEQWQGTVWNQSADGQALAPFSDRYTRTRERQFDTRDLERRPKPEPISAEKDRIGSADTVQKARGTLDLPMVGRTFAGRFEIQALLGEGGSATVFEAIDIELGEPIALKLFRPSTAEQLNARFKLELSLSRQLAHPNIIRLFDLGSHEGWRYLTMELLKGSDLATRLAAVGGRMPLVEGLGYLEQICAGLEAAHQRGVVHRDIKPQNLFVTDDGIVKVMDFGIAKKAGARGITMVGTIVGTPEYIAPEQATGLGNVTHSADLYSLGATAYQMFTGSPPFAQTELVSLLLAHANEPPAPLRVRAPTIDPELEAVILKTLEKTPERRFATARALGQTLHEIRRRLQRPPSSASCA